MTIAGIMLEHLESRKQIATKSQANKKRKELGKKGGNK